MEYKSTVGNFNNSSNETGVDLPVNYVVLDVTAAVLYLPLVVIPSLILYSFILNYYCKKRSSLKAPLNLIIGNYCICALLRNIVTGLFTYVFIPISLKSGSCLGELLHFGITIGTSVLTGLLIALFALTQCILIVRPKRFNLTFKKLAIVLMVIWIYSMFWGIFMFVLWFALKNTLFFCELVGVHAPRYADYSIVSVPLTFVFAEIPPPLLVCISTTTSCIKYNKSKMREADVASLSRKMILLPILMTACVVAQITVQKYFEIIIRSFSTNGDSFVVGLKVFGIMVFELLAGPLFAALLLYFNTPLRSAFKKQMVCIKKNRVHPEQV